MQGAEIVADDAQEIEFDLSGITAADMDGFFRAARANDQAGVARIFPAVVRRCPAAWGDKTRVETYLALPYFGAWKQLVQAFIDEANGKN